MSPVIKSLTDIDSLMSWRREVIGEVFGVAPDAGLLSANRAYYETHIPDGSHIAVVAETDGAEAGCGAICLSDELPSPDNATGRCAYLMNIYVRAPYRSRGIGHAIVAHLVTLARQLGCDKIYLETTESARSLYRGLGFNDLPGIMKYAHTQDFQSERCGRG